MNKTTKWIVYVLAVFLFQELLFRICCPIPEVANFNRINYQVRDNNIYKEPDLFLEDFTWQSSLDTNHVFVHRLNEYGFRDRAWTVKKKKKRVIFIGDSFVEGTMAKDEETMPYYYQQFIGDETEVMNAGMNGTGMRAYLKLIQDIVPLFQPDELKLVLYANDFSPEQVQIKNETLSPELNSPYAPRLYQLLKRLVQGKQIAFKWFRSSRPFLFPVPDFNNPFTTESFKLKKEVTPEVKKAMENATFNYYAVNLLAKGETSLKQKISFIEELKHINTFCAENNTLLSVYYIPTRDQVSNRYIEYGKESCQIKCKKITTLTDEKYQLHALQLSEDCNTLKIKFHDLTPLIRKKEQSKQLYWNYDEHFKSVGYHFVAESVLHLK